ncbi:general stress protein [Bacillus aerolatus]|nr:general stress protein [Bacillus aerolatus]
MANKIVIGLCKTEFDAIRRIEELKVEGYNMDQLYAVTKDADFNLLLQNRTGAEVTSAGPTIMEKVKSIFTKDKPIKEYLLDFGLSEKDAEAYHQDVDDELILLVADEHDEANRETAAAQAASNENKGVTNPPLPTKAETERRQRIQEREQTEKPYLTDDSLIPPNQQPYHRDFF